MFWRVLGNDKTVKEKYTYIFYGKCRINKDSRKFPK